MTASYLRGADGLISETDLSGQTPLTTYNLYSPHGDTAALTDQNGAITQSYRYDSFGNSISGTPPRNGYTGKWQRDTDSATGAIRMGVREYDPALGRFTSADPLKGAPTDPQQRNRYLYAGNDPLSRYDLNGLYWGESYVNGALGWIREKTSLLYMIWQADPIFGPNQSNPPLWGAGREYMPESFEVFDDPAVSTGILIGMGVPGFGTAAYSSEMTSFYGGSRAAREASGGGRGATCTANGGFASGIKSALSGLRSGSSSRIKLVDSVDDLEELYSRLSTVGKPVQGTTYPGGRFVEFPDGTTVGLRTSSRSGGPTIDITLPDSTQLKVHVQQ